jgi:hypothetical protein
VPDQVRIAAVPLAAARLDQERDAGESDTAGLVRAVLAEQRQVLLVADQDEDISGASGRRRAPPPTRCAMACGRIWLKTSNARARRRCPREARQRCCPRSSRRSRRWSAMRQPATPRWVRLQGLPGRRNRSAPRAVPCAWMR